MRTTYHIHCSVSFCTPYGSTQLFGDTVVWESTNGASAAEQLRRFQSTVPPLPEDESADYLRISFSIVVSEAC